MKNFCVLPFVNLEARTDGTIAPCCIMQDDAGVNLAHGGTLKEVWEGEWLDNYRQAFLNGEKPEACNNCWFEEESGIQSKRQRENIWYRFMFDFEDPKATEQPASLDLKLGNICNSKCRICTSFASSQWAKEEIAIDPKKKEQILAFNRNGMWPKNNEHFWEELDTMLSGIVKLEFFGGEPLLIDRHFDILERCIEKGYAENIHLSYNTNGSVFPEEKVHLWKHFRKVQIFFSIDDVEERFNYIRHPGKFNEVFENIEKFTKLEGNIEFAIFQTIGILNICNQKELTEYVKENIPMHIHYNMVFEPKHMSAKCLPEEVKRKITNYYSGEQPEHIRRTLDYINSEQYDMEKFYQFIRTTKFGDSWRDENFVETFPKLYEFIEEYWNGIQ